MSKLILIVGYPGSGKTSYGQGLKDELNAVEYIDDYHKNAQFDSSKFRSGRRFYALIQGLKDGQIWIASDIGWCRAKKTA